MGDDTNSTPQLAAELIPTDDVGLMTYLSNLPAHDRASVADRLAVQLGGTPGAIEKACDLVDNALHEIVLDQQIKRERERFAKHLAAAAESLAAACHSLDVMTNGLCDVEYSEGGQKADDLGAFLDDAARMLRAATRCNPCPPDTKGK